jgi:very-short-patch-repair endonuclease
LKENIDQIFLYDCKTHYVVLEVDEEQHRGKTYECDQKRMWEIAQSLGMPSIFIRYNPDKYKVR